MLNVARTRSRIAILSLPLLVLLSFRAIAQSPPIDGLAHIAIAVADLGKSRDFYNKLGFDEAFHFGEGDKITQSFLKINDRQFLELYPATPRQPVGFLHLCFDGDDLNALYAFYIARGLTPKPVRKAHAGNLLFTMEGPEHQNIEYTQYLPGSLHFDDHGKHLGDHRLSTAMFAVALPMQNREAARSFYVDKLAFPAVPGHPWLVTIPGPSHQQIVFETGSLIPHGRAFFHVDDLKTTGADLKRLGIVFVSSPQAITVTDPDGNLLVFQGAPDAVLGTISNP